MLAAKSQIDEYLANIDQELAELDRMYANLTSGHPDYNTLCNWDHFRDIDFPESHLLIESESMQRKIHCLNLALRKHNAYVSGLEYHRDTIWILKIDQEPNCTYTIHSSFFLCESELVLFIDTLIEDCVQQDIGDLNMNIYKTDAFKYLEGIMLKGKRMTLTIKAATYEQIANANNQENKILLHFEETDKAAIMNKTNLKTLAAEHGGETDDWIGKSVEVYAEKGKWFGKEGWALRVAIPSGKKAPAKRGAAKKKAQTKQKAKAAEEPAEELSPEALAITAKLMEALPHFDLPVLQGLAVQFLDEEYDPDNDLDPEETFNLLKDAFMQDGYKEADSQVLANAFMQTANVDLETGEIQNGMEKANEDLI